MRIIPIYKPLGAFVLLLLIFAMPAPSEVETVESVEPAFNIPYYPNTEPLPASYHMSLTSLPFWTKTMVLKSKDGSLPDSEQVCKYYEDLLSARGWKRSSIVKSEPQKGQLSLTCQFYAPEKGQHVAGNFHMAVAPADGMIILYLYQWRVSSAGQRAINLYNAIEGKFESLIFRSKNDKGLEARPMKLSESASALIDPIFLEDELYLEGRRYPWITSESSPRTIEIIVAFYIDNKAAIAAAKRIQFNLQHHKIAGNVLIGIRILPGGQSELLEPIWNKASKLIMKHL